MRSVITINRQGTYLDSVKVAIAGSDPDIFVSHVKSARSVRVIMRLLWECS